LAFETVYLSNCSGSDPLVGRRPLKEHGPLKWLFGPAGQKSIDALGFLCPYHVLSPPVVVITVDYLAISPITEMLNKSMPKS